MYLDAKRRYINTLPFLSFPFQASSSSHLSKSTRVLSNSQVGRVWTISRFAKLKERELLYLIFMLGFFYGSHRKNEENFEFYKKIRKFLVEL